MFLYIVDYISLDSIDVLDAGYNQQLTTRIELSFLFLSEMKRCWYKAARKSVQPRVVGRLLSIWLLLLVVVVVELITRT
jgi:hypothetical protein